MNRFQGTNSARLCNLAGWYANPIPSRFLAPIDCLKIPAQEEVLHSLLKILQSLIYLGQTVLHGRHPTKTEQQRQLSQLPFPQ
jgi:hypothetical protein